MADETDQSEKTEDPTRKKLEDAHKRGEVAKSQEVNTAAVLLMITLVVMFLSPFMADQLGRYARHYIENAHAYSVDRGTMAVLWMEGGLALLAILGIPFLLLAIAAAGGNLIQHRLVFSFDPVKPKLSKISPIAGAKRLFSPDALMNFAKGLFKLGIVSALMVLVLWSDQSKLETIALSPAGSILGLTHAMAIKALAVALALMLLVAAVDFAWQKHRWWQKQKMSIKEVRDELKDSDGDPAIKAKIRQIRADRSRNRMMSQVPESTVVIANPTHFAVALKYDDTTPAPICVAKGVDALALKIREIAEEHDVPVVENPPLARLLHASIELDQPIPEEHYQAVAEVISYVMKLEGRQRH